MKLSFAPAVVTNRLLGIGWAIVISLLFVVAADSFIRDCGDSCIFKYVAKGILQGETPYLDLWDHKGPLLYLVYVVGLAIDQTWGMWAVQGLFLLGSAYLTFALLRKAFGILPALFTLAMFLTYFSKFAPPGGFTEQFGLLFQFLTLYLFVRSEEQPMAGSTQLYFRLLPLCIGVLGAASFLLRPNLVALWIVIGIYWIFVRGPSLRKLAWAVIGGGCVLISVAALFVALGAWGALWDAVFAFNFAYSNASISERIGVVEYLSTLMFPISILAIAGWLMSFTYIVRNRLRSECFNGIILISVGLLPLEIISLSVSGYEFSHYFLTILPVFTLLLGFVTRFIIEKRLIPPLLLSFALLFGSAYYSSLHASIPQLAENYGNAGSLPGTSQSPLAIRIRDRVRGATTTDDTILVWGRGVWIYLLSERDAPSRFFYEVPLTTPNYTSQTTHEQFLTDIKEGKPKLIIDMRSSRLPPLASIDRQNWKASPRVIHILDDFRPFLEFVEANYIAISSTPPYKYYALKVKDDEANAPFQGQLIIRSTYDVYLDGKTLTYVRRQCANDDAARRFILHVFPVDKSVIDGNELHNMDFSFIDGKDWYVGEACVVSRELPDYAIAYIRTGQYDISRSRHEWLGEYHFSRPN